VVLAFVAATTVLAAIAAGIVPALRASRVDINAVLNDEGRGATGLRIGRLSRGLVMVEMALSFGLLVVAALAIQSIVALSRTDFGFATSDVWVGRVTLPEDRYKGDNHRREFADSLLDRLQAVPGIEAAALATTTPLGAPAYPIAVPGSEYRLEREYPRAWGATISTDYFRVFRVDIRKGRAFDARDRAGLEGVAIVNESFERKYFPDGAVGRQFAVAGGERQWRTIVGVVPDLGLWDRRRNQPGFYLALPQAPTASLVMLLDTSSSPLGVTATVRHAVRGLDPNLPVGGINTLEGLIQENTWGVRVFGTLFTAFGFAALFLATVGLYGVMSFSVRRRTQEIGVRMAMGATTGDVVRMILRHGIVPVAAGMLLGLGLGALLTNALGGLVFNMNPHDPVTFVGIAFVLLLTSFAACLVPARRAAAVNPIEALRYH
jgi:predicted permease